MRFDDRLLTVLNQPALDRHDSAVRWRQLVDLVARAGSSADSPNVIRALDTIRTDAPHVDENLRAAAARAVAALPLPLGLLEYFASDTLTVSSAVLAAARLGRQQWQSLLAVADDETRRFIETLHPEIKAETPSAELTEALVEQVPESAEPVRTAPGPSLHEVVARIERRRRRRAPQLQSAASGAVPEGSPTLFRWECGPGGEIGWVEGAPRGALIGRSIARAQNGEGDGVDQEVTRAFMLRAPFRDAAMTVAGDGLVSGEWKISGVPAFDPADGRFRGYRGVALREQPETAAGEPADDLLSDPDSLRELVHEIKTPLNAIIGFAEIIEGQYLGPADRRYRERAQDIVQQARLLLTAIDDLDFAAKVHSSTSAERRRVDIGELSERMTPALRELAGERGVQLEMSRRTRDLPASVELQLADRLIYRLCNAMIAVAEDGERLRLSVDQSGHNCRFSITRPSSLSGSSDEQLFGTAGQGLEQGFPLRLVRGLARIAGADLVATRNSLSLLFPRA
ncbi:MAG: sensor histidine kinase [Myxococcales bacterium]|nr:histidine kinase dimerization/phospho-acceptor domain-containing protein [Sphingomicrobium sp.]